MAGSRSDLIHAFRLLIRRPGHTLAVVACLAVGLTIPIGAFSVLTSLLYGDRPGVTNRRDMVRLYLSYDDDGDRVTTDSFSHDDFAIVGDGGQALSSLAAEGDLIVAVNGKEGPAAMEAAFVSGAYFAAFGTRAHAGRLLAPPDDLPDAPPVAVVAEHFWRTQLDGKPEAIGQSILVGGRSFTVVGVTPPLFQGIRSGDSSLQVWIPLQYATAWPGAPARSENWLNGVGRIRPGFSVDEVRAQLAVRASQIAADYPSTRANAAVLISQNGLPPNISSVEILMIVSMMLSLPLTVLAIACANVTNLQLARAAERGRELAVRLSFGASRGQLIRLLTLETMFPAAVAVGVSIAATRGIFRLAESSLPIRTSVDWRVAGFSFALVMAVTFATGLVPAWLVLRKPAALGLKQTAQAGGLSLSRLRSSLVIAQVAVSLMMLCGAGLVLRSATSLELDVPAALRSQIVADFDPAHIGESAADASRLAEDLVARAKSDPRIREASISRTHLGRYSIPDGADGERRSAALVEMTPSWLDVMDLRILIGRPLSSMDVQGVGLVSARLADELAPGGSPLGRILSIEATGTQRRIEIVGVVADNPTGPMVTGSRPDPVIYAPLPRDFSGPFTLRIRTHSSDSVAAVSAELRNLVRAVDPRLPWLTLQRGEDAYMADAPSFRYVALAIASLGLLALALASTGLYAVMSYAVLLRRREIGVRMAIGANARQIVKMMVWQAFRLVLTGGAIGLGLAIPLAFGLRSVFIGTITPLDPAAYLPPFALLLLVGLLASALPAIRASATDPNNTLRED